MIKLSFGHQWNTPGGVFRNIRAIIRYCHDFIERGANGWAKRDTYCLDNYLSKVISGTVAHLKLIGTGFPADLNEKKWDAILEEISSGFKGYLEIVNMGDDWSGETESYKEAYDKSVKNLNKSIKLMAKYFPSLWD